MYCGPPDQLLDLNWNQTMDPSGHFELALSSIVSSSQSSSSPASADGMAFHKLMGGLQSIGNSGNEISPQSHHIGVSLDSHPKLNLSMMGHFHQQQQQAMGGLPVSGIPMPLTHLDQLSADLGFSSFDGRSYGHLPAQFGVLDTEKLAGMASGQSLKTTRLQIGLPQGRKEVPVRGKLQLDINNGELVNAREESSVSNPDSGEVSLGSNAKKRKAPLKGMGKEASLANSAIDPPKVTEEEDCDAKRCRSMEKNGNENDAVKLKVEQNDGCSSNGNGGQKQSGDSTAKSPEPPKDYIHVRARRGQATDSHSLAERVRREKISQRMKLLQDLVPGCSKVTGKAVMLDEIINYVQSLQRQVEFLSMKLATVNPHLDFNNLANLLPKDLHQTCESMPNSVYSLETSGVTPPYVNQPQQGTSLHGVLPNGTETQSSVNLLDSTFHQNLNTQQLFLAGFESASSQLGTFWEDDLHNVTHMDIGQN